MAPHASSAYPTPLATPPNEASYIEGVQTPISVLTSTRAVISGVVTPATITVSSETGKILDIRLQVIPRSAFPQDVLYRDYSPKILLPGLVDAHVHLNEPGRTEWEGFWTGTRAAAFGGVTTVIDMPLNAIPPTTTVANLGEKVAAAQGKCWVDVGFYGGLIPGNTSELRGLVQAGVRGFKGFLIDSGVSRERGTCLCLDENANKYLSQVEEFPAVSSTDIGMALVTLSDLPTTVMFHAEMIPPITDSVGDDVQTSLPPLYPKGPLNAYQTFLDSRPAAFETYAIEEIISLAGLAPSLPLHIVHLSAIEAIPLLQEARSRGVNITSETCFHYLSLAAEEIAHGDTRHKCCPPIRKRDNQTGLWQELLRESGVIKTVVSDHSPCTPGLKLLPTSIGGHANDGSAEQEGERGDFFSAWGGISSVGLGLSILWTEQKRRGFEITDVVRWCCQNTAKQVGLEHVKGDIAVGMDADIAVFDDEAEFVVQPSTMLFRNKCSPYQGKTLRGVVTETWLRGKIVHTREHGFAEKRGPSGQLLLEPRTSRICQ